MGKTYIHPAHRDFSWTDDLVAEAVLRSPDIAPLAARIPLRPSNTAGRPSEYPDAVYVLFMSLAATFGSQRAAAGWLGNKRNWFLVRKHAQRRWGFNLPLHGPTRSTCGYNFRRIATLSHSDLREEIRVLAIAQAKRQGCLTSDSETMSAPPRRNVVTADGTVPKCRFRSTTYKRLEDEGKAVPVAAFYKEGGDKGSWVHGQKELILSVRPDSFPNSRVLLATVPVHKTDDEKDGYGNEAALAVKEALRLRDEESGFLGFWFDGALRGTHIDPLEKAGLCVTSPLRKDDKRRVYADVDCSNGHTHTLYTSGGEFVEERPIDTGKKIERVCKRVKQYARATRANGGYYRWYVDIKLVCGAIYRERLDMTAEDIKRGYNRTERVRQHPTESKTYKDTYGWRADIESVNNNLDSSMYRQRMIVDTPERQALIMIGFIVSRNAVSAAVYAARVHAGLLDDPPGATGKPGAQAA